jgi:hypothetical protein
MGRTSTAIKPFPTYNSPKPIRGSWESNLARVKASKKYLEYWQAHKNNCNLIQWTSGYIGLIRTGDP